MEGDLFKGRQPSGYMQRNWSFQSRLGIKCQNAQ